MFAPFTLVTLALAAAPAQFGERLFQPRDYSSCSGAYVLRVSPSDPLGTGSMRCTLAHGRDEVWSAELPWTFEEAGVALD